MKLILLLMFLSLMLFRDINVNEKELKSILNSFED